MYAVFVITAMLLAVAPMHARALLSTVMPAGVPAQRLDAASPDVRRNLAPATRLASRRIPLPAHLTARPVTSNVQPPSPAPIVLAEADPLAHTPNAP